MIISNSIVSLLSEILSGYKYLITTKSAFRLKERHTRSFLTLAEATDNQIKICGRGLASRMYGSCFSVLDFLFFSCLWFAWLECNTYAQQGKKLTL